MNLVSKSSCSGAQVRTHLVTGLYNTGWNLQHWSERSDIGSPIDWWLEHYANPLLVADAWPFLTYYGISIRWTALLAALLVKHGVTCAALLPLANAWLLVAKIQCDGPQPRAPLVANPYSRAL
jgi:hypothetical protein